MNSIANRRLFVIADTGKFVVQALLRDLEQEGFEFMVIEPNATSEEFGKLDEDGALCLLYMGGEVYIQLFSMLSEKVAAGLTLFVAGSEADLLEISHRFSHGEVADYFTLPLSMRFFSSAVERYSAPRKKRILVVDDDAMMLRSIKAWLCEEYEITLVNSGRNALTYLEKHTVDLILLDYEMPLMSGSELLGHLRADSRLRQFPVIFLTAKDDKDSVMNVMSLKPDGYLLKSRPSNEITATVHEFFDKRSKRTLHEEKPNA